jgi:hypothetical protein
LTEGIDGAAETIKSKRSKKKAKKRATSKANSRRGSLSREGA